MAANGQLVFTDVDKVTFKGVGDTSNAVIDTTTGKIGVGVDSPDANLHVLGNCFVSTNLELGGTMTMGTVTVNARHELSAITATGNTTPHTVEFQNAETGLVTTGNVSVGKDLTVTGNVAVDTDTLFVDSVNNRVGIGTTTPGRALEIAADGGGAILNLKRTNIGTGQGAIGFVNLNSNVCASITSSRSGAEGGELRFFTAPDDTTQTSDNPYLINERMRIDSDGNVGVGNGNPRTKLDIFDTGGCTMRLTTDNVTPQGTIDIIRGDNLRSPNDYTFGASNYYDWRIGSDDTTDYNFTIRRKGGGLDTKALVIDGTSGNITINGTISYNTKQATHQKNANLTYTNANVGQNLKSVTISTSGIAHVHVTGLWRLTAFSGTNGTSTEAAYFNIKKNSTEVTASYVGHRMAKLGNANDNERWVPIVMSWSGAVSSGDTINVYASSIENNIEFNELDLNVLVV
jgi:hypothetical protein